MVTIIPSSLLSKWNRVQAIVNEASKKEDFVKENPWQGRWDRNDKE